MKKGKTLLLVVGLFAVFTLQSPARAALEFGLDCNNDGIIDESCYLEADDFLVADLYVSNVPEPGLFNAAFRLDYDSNALELVEDDTNVYVDFDSYDEMLAALDAGDDTWKNNGIWDQGNYAFDTPGEVAMGLIQNSEYFSGNMIKLATFSFRRTGPGPVFLTVYTRDDPDNTVDDFVLEDDEHTVLDDDLNGGLQVAEITDVKPAGPDYDDDGDVDGQDVVAMMDVLENCMADCYTLAEFAPHFGETGE